MKKNLSRRSALKLVGLTLGSTYLSGCSFLKKNESISATDYSFRRKLAEVDPGALPFNFFTDNNGNDFNPIERSKNTLGDKALSKFSGDAPDRTHVIMYAKKDYLRSRIQDETLPAVGSAELQQLTAASLVEKIKVKEENLDVVIVGAGISGLMAAFDLRSTKPVILDRAERFGGNARGESWGGLDYGIGAAYFMGTEHDEQLAKLYKDLDLISIAKDKDAEDPVILNQKRFNAFWSGETDPKRPLQFILLEQYFESTFNEKNGLVRMDIPFRGDVTNIKSFSDKQKAIAKLDNQTFESHVFQILKQKLTEIVEASNSELDKIFSDLTESLKETKIDSATELQTNAAKELDILNSERVMHSHIRTAMQHYCWSSFGAEFHVVSAAAGLNFFTAEFGKVYVTPGGNGGAAEHILKKIADSFGAIDLEKKTVNEEKLNHHFRAQSIVIDVQVDKDGVHILYLDSKDQFKKINAKTCIMACPKYIAKHILSDLRNDPNELDRFKAIEGMKYNSYLVANVLIDKHLEPDFYDLFMIGNGDISSKDINNLRDTVKNHAVTDVVLGTYAQKNDNPNDPRAILTLYHGLPYREARKELYGEVDRSEKNPSLFSEKRKETEKQIYKELFERFEKQLKKEILPLLNLTEKNVVDLRITRWGHPLPVAQAGWIAQADTTIKALERPIGGKLFFANQDNWCLPSFESATISGLKAAKKVKDKLQNV